MSLVLDSSATLAWIYADETTDEVRRIFEIVAEDGAHVPTLWRLEVTNSLTVAARRGRIDVVVRWLRVQVPSSSPPHAED